MNTKKLLIFAALTLACAMPIHAQTSPPPTPPPAPEITGIASTVSGWLTSRDTNSFFQDALIWDGPVYQNHINVANELGASLDLWRSAYSATNAASGLFAAVESRTRNTGVAGSFASQGVGGEFGWMSYDVRIGGFVDGVYRFQTTTPNQSRMAAEFGLFASKLLSKNAGAGFFVSWQTGENSPFIGGQLSVSFGNGSGFLGLFSRKSSP